MSSFLRELNGWAPIIVGFIFIYAGNETAAASWFAASWVCIQIQKGQR